MNENELWFTTLGPSGAGKTTLLACMQKKFDELLPGSIVADRGTFNALSQAYRKLEAEANSPAFEFGVAVENTENLREYAFVVNGGGAAVPMRFFDFPGGWMDSGSQSQAENYEKVIQIVRSSRVVIAAVSAPYLMEGNGRYRSGARVEEIEQAMKQGLSNDRGNKLILLVPIKCEKYTRTAQERLRLRETLEQAFAATLGLPENPAFRDRLAIAMLPIHTVGNAQFSRFEFENADPNGRILREIYLKNRQKGFSPSDADQPLRFAMSFLLNEFVRGDDEALNSAFSRKDLKALGDFIRKDMRPDDPAFKIYCGRGLITDVPGIFHVPSRPASGSARPSEKTDTDRPAAMAPVKTVRADMEAPREPDRRGQDAPKNTAGQGQTERRGRFSFTLGIVLFLAGLAATAAGMVNGSQWGLWLLAGGIASGLAGVGLMAFGRSGAAQRQMTRAEWLEQEYQKASRLKKIQDWKFFKSAGMFEALGSAFDALGTYRDSMFLAQECFRSAGAVRVRYRGLTRGLLVLAGGTGAFYYLSLHMASLPDRLLSFLLEKDISGQELFFGGTAASFLAALFIWWRSGAKARAILCGRCDEELDLFLN